MEKQRFLSSITLWMLALCLYAQPNGTGDYYKNADGEKGSGLKTALYSIINSPDVISYSGLWECYKTTDLRPDGKIWDMYSDMTNFDPDKDRAGNYKKEGDVYNREHSFPKSWFSEGKPMYSDLFHLVPTDGYINGRRSNYPFGETDGENYKSHNGFSKVGTCTVPGYSGIVFEPNDEYKGDFARIYFYMATCYEKQIASWSSDMLDGSSYPAYKNWALQMLLKWAANDPVSQKEIDRNNAVYALQGNRNPYVDYPGLEQYVWGNKTEVAFSYDNYDSTVNPNPDPDPKPDPDPDPDPDPVPDPIEGEQIYKLVASSSDFAADTNYLLVYTSDDNNGKALAAQISTGKAYDIVDVAISDNTITTTVNETESPHDLYIAASNGSYTIFDTKSGQYLSLPKSENALRSAESVGGDAERWNISINDGYAEISNSLYTTRTIRYNTTSPRFACYTSGQQPVRLYKRQATSSINAISTGKTAHEYVYSIDGRRISKAIPDKHPSSYLNKGIYIIGDKKIVVK